MDGWALLQTLRDLGVLNSLRVVVVSAHVSEDVSKRAAAFGARYLTKPFDIETLRRVVTETLASSLAG
jgi:CheY-like chemotaxis protein